jgi:ribonuclease BN (tRNA processing enzyme)
VTTLTFLGTGNFLAPPGRYWNSFVLDTNILVEPSPTALPHLRRCGFAVEDVEVVVVSHFHADHCFGWPFLLEALAEVGGGRTVHVVGPPGLEAHLAQLNEAGAVGSVTAMASARLDLRFVEVDGEWQEAGPLRFRAVEVVHVPYLRCFGYLFERGGQQVQVVGYSGDVTPCAGLTELAREADVLVVECNGRHTPPGAPTVHMDEESIRALAAAHPDTQLILTHLGEQVDTGSLRGTGALVPDDFDRLTI